MNRRGSRVGLLIGVLAILLTTSCGDKIPAANETGPSPTPTPSDTPAPTPSASPTPTEEPSPVAAEFGAGDIVLSNEDLAMLCSEATGAIDDYESDGFAGSVARILPSGVVVLACDSEDVTVLAAVDARADALLWTRTLLENGDPTYEYLLDGGAVNLYVASGTYHPAEGLTDETYSRDVTAIDARTGADLWTQPLLPEVTDDGSLEGAVMETPSADGGTLAVVNVGDYSAFDAVTGSPLWRVPELDPRGRLDSVTYVGYGRTIGLDWADDDTFLTGTDLGSGKQVWATPVDGDRAVFGNAYSEFSVGTSYWVFNDEAFDAYDVLTGELVAHGIFPTSFENTLATPTFTVALVDKSLRVYRTGDWSSVVWSLPADSASPLLATDKAVVVSAEAGTLLLDMADGQILDDAFPYSPTQDEVIGGLYATDDGEIVEMGEV